MYEEVLKEIIDKINLINDDGIVADVRGFFRGYKIVKQYKINVNKDKKYELHITLENSSSNVNENIFFEFMKFIQYSSINLFSKIKYGEKYIYLSANDDMRGFCFEVYFEI